MKLESLQPGMTVYSVSRGKMGNTTLSTVNVHPVFIKEVDAATQSVLASWNHNAPQKFYRKRWSQWRKEKPILIGRLQQRLATRAEIKAMKKLES